MIVRLPPLDQRQDEVPLLAARFLERAPEETGVMGGPSRFTPDALAALVAHHYAGNVRELRELVWEGYLHAVQVRSAVLSLEHLDAAVMGEMRYDRRRSPEERRRAVEWALTAEGGNIARAARRVGVSRNTVKALRAPL
jgi:DNA-binding NtrC family response regulator